jgi:hypothetical protein
MILVGAVGLGHAVGTTYFSLMTAEYLAGVRRKKTALVEWNPGGAFRRIAAVYGGKAKKAVPAEACRSFVLMETVLYTDGDSELLIRLSNIGYAACVIDFGVMREEIRSEFLRCTRRFAVAAATRWQVADLAEFAAGEGKKARCEYVAAFGGRRQLDLAERYLGIRIGRVPLSADPCAIDGKVMAFFGQLWREGL